MIALLILLAWFFLWTVMIYKFDIKEDDWETRLLALLLAPLVHLHILIWYGLKSYLSDWNKL